MEINNISDMGANGAVFSFVNKNETIDDSFNKNNKLTSIKEPINGYVIGDFIILELIKGSEEEIKSVSWTYDGKEHPASTPILLEEGIHTIIATLEYSNRSEIITKKIDIK